MNRIIGIIIIGIILLAILALGAGLFLPFWLRGTGLSVMRPGMMLGFSFPFFIMRGLGTLLFWLLVIGGVFLLLRAVAGSPQTPVTHVAADESPLEILQRRYAKGEISKEQYDEMRNTLGVQVKE